MRQIASLYSLNRGVVSRFGLARQDVKRLNLAAEDQTNWMPKVLGPMTLRPGFGYISGILSNLAARLMRFVFATDDTALIELTNLAMRVRINDVLLTRPTVTAAVANGSFTSDVASWTDNDDAGATSSWVTGYLQLVGNGTARAIRDQTVTVNEANVEHALRVVIARGPVMIRVGTSTTDDSYVNETTLYEGTHSLAFTPTGNFNIRFFSTLERVVWVDSCTIESAGVVSITTPWPTASLGLIRYDQSADVLFVACAGYQQRRIERRGTGRSWSVALYQADDGPFRIENTGPITITTSAISGNVTLTASLPLFRSTHVGSLFSVTSVGQEVSTTTAVNGTATSSIRVTGFGATERPFAVVITGNASASTIDLQRSFDNATWANLGGAGTYTTNVSTTVDDGLANQIVYYRLILTNRVAPDSITMLLRIGSGSIRGVARITAFSSSTSVSAEVLNSFGGVAAATIWQEGQWSDFRGWPTATKLHEGRLWWFGKNGVWGSVSDAYDSFDEEFVGNAGPINRTVGAGPVDTVNWGLSLKGLLVGAQGTEFTVRASSLDEPLTPTNFNIKGSSTQGSGAVEAVKVDQAGFFVNRSRTKIFELGFNVSGYDFTSSDLTQLAPEIAASGVVRMDVQRLPDTRIHCVLGDGTAIVGVYDKAEEVLAWIPIETDGEIEDVAVLPALDGDLDDQVYYVVKRTINGSDVRYLEKWAQELDCRGGTTCNLADSYINFTGGGTVVTGLDHLEGENVVVWADGADVGTNDSARPWTQTYTVSGGQITLAVAASNVTVGLPYTADFKSAKLGLQTQIGSPLSQTKKASQLGIIAADIHPKGVRYGADFDHLDDMPGMEGSKAIDQNAMRTDYDTPALVFPGTWTTDMRVCIRAVAPRPATIIAITVDQVVT
jgi:hypothetical protein